MTWVRKGRIFSPADHPDWAGTHAQVPTALVLPDRVRIFYADRNGAGKSYTTYLDVDRRERSGLGERCVQRDHTGLTAECSRRRRDEAEVRASGAGASRCP